MRRAMGGSYEGERRRSTLDDTAGSGHDRRPMGSLLRTLPIVALVLATTDAVLVRAGIAHRPTEPLLLLQAWVLWAVFALLALPFAAWHLRRLRHRWSASATEPDRFDAGTLLAVWAAAPVALHGVLDRHTGIGGAVGGLASVRPWVEVALATLLLAALATWLARGLRAALDRDLPGGVPATGAALVAVLLAGLLLPWRARPAAAGGDATGRPNLLLLVWDTARSDRLAPYGYARDTTPHLAELAAESIVWNDARSVSTFTFTSHLSMLTGTLPSTHGARMLDMRYRPHYAGTMVEELRRAGYRTGAFVGTDVLAGRTGIRHGFEVYDDRVDPPVCDTRAWRLVHDLQAVAASHFGIGTANGQPHWFQDFQRPASDVLASAAAWIAEDDPRPWFCLVNLYDVHWPYLPQDERDREALVRRYQGPLDGWLFRSDAWQPGRELTGDDVRHVSDLYDAELRALDRDVDAFLDDLALDRGGTAVLLTSDHGESFGEPVLGKRTWKHEDVHEAQLRVPFLLRLPEPSPVGEVRAGPLSGIDVAPTLLGLAGVAPPAGTEGADVLAGPVDPAREVLVEDRDHVDPTEVNVVLYRGRWKLVRRGLAEATRFELFDLAADPLGLTDVAAEHPAEAAELRVRLAELRAAADARDGDPTLLRGLGANADALKALGYASDEDG
jgi:arylsulfatase A-like enzyme